MDEWIIVEEARRLFYCFDAPHTNTTDVPVQDGGAE
jgi:hypothetical protein